MGSEPEHAAKAKAKAERKIENMDALVIDDNEAWAKAVLWALKRIVPADWDVRSVNNARTGGYLLIMDRDLKLALVDYLMPIQLGDEIIEEAIAVRPKLRGKIIVCSGLDDLPPEVEEKLFVTLGCKKLSKPVDFETLEKLVLEIIAPEAPAS